MKKLMFAAAIVAATTGLAEGVEGANIVGYSQVEIPNGKSLVTPCFKKISGGQFNLKDIKVLNEKGEEFGTTLSTKLVGNKVKINKLSAGGAFLDVYTYIWTTDQKGWYDVLGTTPVTDENPVLFNDGEGMLVTNEWKDKSKGDNRTVYFQVSGEVALYGQNAFPSGKSIAGNYLARAVDLTEIKVLNENGEEFGTTLSTKLVGNKVKINKLSAAGAFGDVYTYIWTSDQKGWYDVLGTTPVKVGDIVLQPGDAFLLTNEWKNKGSDERIIYLKMPNVLDPMPVPETK